MKYIFLFSILTSLSYGQKDSTRSAYYVIYGQKYLSHKTLNGIINSVGDIKFGAPVTYVGIGTSGITPINREFNSIGSFNYTQILPQKITINDTIKAGITGFNIGLTFLGIDFFPRPKNFDIFLSFGINAGRLRLYGNSYINQKNPYFSPKISLMPRIIVKNMCFQIQIDYEVDVLSKNWRRVNSSDSPKINLPKTSSTGFTALATVGYVLRDRKTNKTVVGEEE